MNNKAIGSSWTDVRKEIFTPEEILESDLRIFLMDEIIKARHDIRAIISAVDLKKLMKRGT